MLFLGDDATSTAVGLLRDGGPILIGIVAVMVALTACAVVLYTKVIAPWQKSGNEKTANLALMASSMEKGLATIKEQGGLFDSRLGRQSESIENAKSATRELLDEAKEILRPFKPKSRQINKEQECDR